MDLDSAEDSNIVRAAAALAAAVICLAIVFRFVLDSSLSKVNDSLTRGLEVVEQVDAIVDDLDRVRLDQRAFLSTGEDCYSEDLVISATEILRHLDALQRLPVRGQALRHQIARMSQTADSVLNLVGESNDFQQSYGTAVALELLDGEGNNSIQKARMAAMQLKRLATERVLYRIVTQGKLRSILDGLF